LFWPERIITFRFFKVNISGPSVVSAAVATGKVMAAATLDWTVTRKINGPRFGETKTFTVDLSPNSAQFLSNGTGPPFFFSFFYQNVRTGPPFLH